MFVSVMIFLQDILWQTMSSLSADMIPAVLILSNNNHVKILGCLLPEVASSKLVVQLPSTGSILHYMKNGESELFYRKCVSSLCDVYNCKTLISDA